MNTLYDQLIQAERLYVTAEERLARVARALDRMETYGCSAKTVIEKVREAMKP